MKKNIKNIRKWIITGSFFLVCFYSQLSLANDGVGLKLNTSANQLHFSCLYSHDNTRLEFSKEYRINLQFSPKLSGHMSDTLPDILTEDLREQRSSRYPWVIYELIGSIGGAFIGMFGGAFLFSWIDLRLDLGGEGFGGMAIGIPIGLWAGSYTGTRLIGAIGNQKGNLDAAFAGAGIGTLFVAYRMWHGYVDSDVLLLGCPAVGAVLGYNLF